VHKFKAWILQQPSEPAPEDFPVNNTMNETQFIPQFDSPFDNNESMGTGFNEPQQSNITDSKFHMQRDLTQKQNTQILPPEESKQQGGWEPYHEENDSHVPTNFSPSSRSQTQDFKAGEVRTISMKIL